MIAPQWICIDDPEAYAHRILGIEAPDIPKSLLAGPWAQTMIAIAELSVNEAMVEEHDAEPVHCERRDQFVHAMRDGDPVPPLIAIGTHRRLVDGYARLRAARLLGVAEVAVIFQTIA